MYSLFTKTLYDKRAFVIGWSLGLAFIGYLMTIFYPAFHQNDAIDQLTKSLPPAFQGLVGNLDNLKTLPTYLGSQLFEVRMPIFVSVLTIILAVSLTVSEEEKGQLRTLLGLPLSRTRVLFAKWTVAVIICGCVAVATLAGIKLGLWAIGESIDWLVLIRLGGMMWLLSVALATIIISIGLATGKKGFTTGIGVLVTVGSFLLTTFAASVEWLKPYEHISLLHYFPAPVIAKGTVNLSDIAVYIGVIAISLFVAFLLFRRRDVR